MADTSALHKTIHRKNVIYTALAAGVSAIAAGGIYFSDGAALLGVESAPARVFVLEGSPLQGALAGMALLAMVSLTLLLRLLQTHRIQAKRAAEDLRRAGNTIHDPITGLLTAPTLSRELQSVIDQGHAGAAAVIAFEVARLDVLRETAGDQAADRVLVEIGRTLRSFGSQLELVSRVEGGTFVALVECADKATTPMQTVRGLRDALGGYRQIGGQRVHIRLGFGIALVPEDGTVVETLLKNAIAAARQSFEGQTGDVRFVSRHTRRRPRPGKS